MSIAARRLVADSDARSVAPFVTLEWIDRGAITATITQKPYVMSYYGLKFLDDRHHNAVHQFKDWRTALAPPMPTSVDTGTVVVDKSNLNLYRETLVAHPKPL